MSWARISSGGPVDRCRPSAGLSACSLRDEKHVRMMPGRLPGGCRGQAWLRADADARAAHPPRRHRTSAPIRLCALAFVSGLLGEKGLRPRDGDHRLACMAANQLAKVPGVKVSIHLLQRVHPAARWRCAPRSCASDQARHSGGRVGSNLFGNTALANGLLVAVTETTTEEDVETLASALEEVLA